MPNLAGDAVGIAELTVCFKCAGKRLTPEDGGLACFRCGSRYYPPSTSPMPLGRRRRPDVSARFNTVYQKVLTDQPILVQWFKDHVPIKMIEANTGYTPRYISRLKHFWRNGGGLTEDPAAIPLAWPQEPD